MADVDEYYYLQPGYDLSNVTVPRLREILVKHNIGFPSSAKKGDLIDIVQTDLLPQARKLLRDRDRVRRTSRGITDVPSSQDGTLDDSDDRERMPPPPAPKTPRGRKSKSQLNEDEVDTAPKSTRRSKTPSRRRTAKTPRKSDTETTETEQELVPPSSRKTRKSITPAPAAAPVTHTPSVKVRDASNKRTSRGDEDSPFTQDNPFQQSSSPPAESARVPSSSRARKSIGAASAKKSTSRRQTHSPIEIKRESVEFPVSHLSTGADGIETTEEFTADARQELGRDMNTDRRIAKSRDKDVRKLAKKPPSRAAKAAPWTVLVGALSVVAAWYRQEKVAVGYCGIGAPSWSLAEVDNVPSWVHETFQPECEPCPQHAICYPNMKVECEHDFILRQHPLSLNGLVPFPPTCEPDSEKEIRIKKVADRALQILRDRRADYECGSSLSSSSSSAVESSSSLVVPPASQKLEISEEALREVVTKQRRKGMTEDEFDDLWNSALGDIKNREEVEVVVDKSGHSCLISTSFANLPFTCSLRRSAVRTLAANRGSVLLLTFILSAIAYAYQRLHAFNIAKSQTPQLVAMTLDRLATQAALHEDGRASEPFISVGQLRDDVLRNVFSRAERERAWERVRKVVEANSNVRAATREGGRTGEWSRVWEWIGAVNFIEGFEGRRSGGGGLIGSSPPAAAGSSDNGTPAAANGEAKVTTMDVRKWDEGRAIY